MLVSSTSQLLKRKIRTISFGALSFLQADILLLSPRLPSTPLTHVNSDHLIVTFCNTFGVFLLLTLAPITGLLRLHKYDPFQEALTKPCPSSDLGHHALCSWSTFAYLKRISTQQGSHLFVSPTDYEQCQGRGFQPHVSLYLHHLPGV